MPPEKRKYLKRTEKHLGGFITGGHKFMSLIFANDIALIDD